MILLVELMCFPCTCAHSEALSYFFFFILNLGDQARSMLIQSGLSQGILAQIW